MKADNILKNIILILRLYIISRAKTKSICNCKRFKFNVLVIREIIKREKNVHPACESNSGRTRTKSDVIRSAITPSEENF